MTFNPSASSTQLQAGAVPGVSMASLGLSRGVRCVWQEIKHWLPPPPAQVRGPQLVQCLLKEAMEVLLIITTVIIGSLLLPSVFKRLKCISLDTSWALGTDSREQALPGLAGLPRHCFQESQRLRSDRSSPVPPVPSSPLSSTLHPLYTQLPDGLCSFLLPNL